MDRNSKTLTSQLILNRRELALVFIAHTVFVALFRIAFGAPIADPVALPWAFWAIADFPIGFMYESLLSPTTELPYMLACVGCGGLWWVLIILAIRNIIG